MAGEKVIASHHASAFAFEILAKFQPGGKGGAGATIPGHTININGDVVGKDKVMGDKVGGDKISNGNSSATGQGSASTVFYQRQLQQKMQDLAAVERDLEIHQTQENERKLNNRAAQLLQEIEDLNKKIGQ